MNFNNTTDVRAWQWIMMIPTALSNGAIHPPIKTIDTTDATNIRVIKIIDWDATREFWEKSPEIQFLSLR